MEEKATRYLIILAAVLCAILIGYNAFYVPDSTMSELKVTADPSSVSQPVSSGEGYIPDSVSSAGPILNSSSPESSETGFSTPAQTHSRSPAKGGMLMQGKINLNTASAQQLSEGIKGVGDALAKRIVDYRNQHGNFRSVDELKNVSGIGDAKLKEIRESVTVG